ELEECTSGSLVPGSFHLGADGTAPLRAIHRPSRKRRRPGQCRPFARRIVFEPETEECLSMSRSRLVGALVLFLLPISLLAADPFRFPEAKHGKAELKYLEGVPVIQVEGKPAEIGEQMAVLTVKSAEKLLDYPRDYLKSRKLDFSWPLIVKMAQGMAPQFPPDYLQEIDTGVKVARLDRELLIAANAAFDIKRMMGCAALIVEPQRSASKQILFGRNLDFPTLDY